MILDKSFSIFALKIYMRLIAISVKTSNQVIKLNYFNKF